MTATPPAASVAVVHTRLTKAEALEIRLRQGPALQPGEVFDEGTQEWMPLGQKLALDRAHRLADPDQQLADFKRARDALVLFIREELEEAEYNRAGYPIAGKLHDFYTMPDFQGRKAITKQGAEKVADLRRWRKASSPVTACSETKEYVSARVNVTLVDGMGQPVGSYEAACSSAEKGFQSPGTQEKYGAKYEWEEPQGPDQRAKRGKKLAEPDWRAALNDIVARAGVRAFRGAVLVAAAMDEIFDLALSTGAESDDAGAREDREANGGRADPQRQPPAAAAAAESLVVTLDTAIPFGKYDGKHADKHGELRPQRTVRQAGYGYFQRLVENAAEEDKRRFWFRFASAAVEAFEVNQEDEPEATIGDAPQPAAAPPAPDAGPLVPEAGPLDSRAVGDEEVKRGTTPPPARKPAPAAAEEPESAQDRLARMHQEVQRLIADEGTPADARARWREFYFGLGQTATLDDLDRIAANLRSARKRASKAATTK